MKSVKKCKTVSNKGAENMKEKLYEDTEFIGKQI